MRILILLLTFQMILNSCSKKNEITETEIYDTLNRIIADDSLHITKLCSKLNNLALTLELEKKFNREDIEFIKEQKLAYINTKLKPNKLKNGVKNYYTKSKDFIQIDSVFNEGIVYYFSFPLISKDRKTILIEISEDCNAMLCGFSGKFLYVKKNDRWILKEKIDFITS